MSEDVQDSPQVRGGGSGIRGLRGAGHRFVRINCVGSAVWTDRIAVEGGQVLVGEHRPARTRALLPRARCGLVPHAEIPARTRPLPALTLPGTAFPLLQVPKLHKQAPLPALPRRTHSPTDACDPRADDTQRCPQARPGRRGHALPGGDRPVGVEEEEGEGSVRERRGRRRLDRRPPEPSGRTGGSARPPRLQPMRVPPPRRRRRRSPHRIRFSQRLRRSSRRMSRRMPSLRRRRLQQRRPPAWTAATSSSRSRATRSPRRTRRRAPRAAKRRARRRPTRRSRSPS